VPELAPDGSWLPVLDLIASFEELHVLLTLAEGAPRVWSLTELSARHPTIDVPQAIEALVVAGLARHDPRGVGPTTDPVLAAASVALLSQYRSNPLLILNPLTERALARVRTAAVRTFADAFVVRPKREEDKG